MTTLDDKILGEKLQYYYSSSEDEGSDNEDEDGERKTIRDGNVEEPEIDYSADGSAVNTGTLASTCTTRKVMSRPLCALFVQLKASNEKAQLEGITLYNIPMD